MQYVNLGRSGLMVSRLCLGCMSFGKPGRGRHWWTLDDAQSGPMVRAALEAGIKFFDLFQIQGLDPNTAIEKIVETVHDIREVGSRALYRYFVDARVALRQRSACR